jgi:signal transduction histidine kinase/DNA-binding response OmpR family regulator
LAPDDHPAVPSPDPSPSGGELERVLAELREANARLVFVGIQLHEMTEQAEARRSQAEAATAEAEAASHAKDEFLAVLSHELRTPLNAILGWTHMLRRGTLKATVVDRALDIIERNAKLQMQLIGDLLEVSQIISGKLRLDVHSVDLAPLTAASLDAFQPAARAKDIRLESHIEPVRPILGDPARVQQILWNLLSNALKFTPKRGRVHVGLVQAGTAAQITVRDSGVGIQPAFLPYVFDRFRQGETSYSRTFGGLGLGLAIVRQLVQLHGGTVKAESAGKELGSTFTVTLPSLTATLDSASSDPQVTAAHALEGLRVLVIENEPDSRDLFTLLLQESGAYVTAAASAGEALALLDTRTVDVIVADIGLPNQDGYAFIRQVRAGEGDGPHHVPALALTACARTEDRGRVLASGYQMHVAKPVEPDQLIAAVASLARHASTARSSEAASSGNRSVAGTNDVVAHPSERLGSQRRVKRQPRKKSRRK